MTNLLPPNASAAERAFATLFGETMMTPTPTREVWNPDTCPANLLPWLAWALSVDSWKAAWPEAVRRNVVRTAIAIQRRKGSVQSVRAIVNAFGGAVILREWHEQDPPADPYTFELAMVITGEGGAAPSAEFVQDVVDEVARTKPVRAHFTFSQGVPVASLLGVLGAGRAALYRRLEFQEAA